ncbi:hypothetical protein MMC31_005535 [Peltigera leucophlebia]|nr:hypothetical protein [Peltigera leucophlebia]
MESPLPPNPYKTLGVPHDATLATIRSARGKLVLTCHPDKFQDEAVKLEKSEQFHQVQQAFEILSDETKRQRYDERVKLAELRAEVMKEKGGSRVASGSEYVSRPASKPNSQSKPPPVYEVREPRVYQERAPNHSYEDNIFSEARPTTWRYDDRYSPPASRRSSAQMPDDKRKARDTEDKRYTDKDRIHARRSTKAAEMSVKHGQEKRKDKDKRKDREARFSSKSPYIGGDEESDSDAAEGVYVKSSSTRQRPVENRETRRKDRDEIPRRGSRREGSDHSLEMDSKLFNATDYIRKMIDPETRRAPHFSSVEYETRLPPSVPPVSTNDNGRRSSARQREGRRISPDRPSGRDRHITEIVDPPSGRKPSIPRLSPELRTSKVLGTKAEPLRAPITSEPRHPSILRRADTMPLIGLSGTRRSDPHSSKTKSKTSDIHDPGYTSPGELYKTTAPPFQRKTTTYQVNTNHEEARKSAQRIYLEPEEIGRDRDRDRDREREREDRTPTAVRSYPRAPPLRSYTFSDQTEKSSSRLRADAHHNLSSQTRPSRVPETLFGELPDEKPYKVVYQPQIRKEDISFSRDAYPGSLLEPRGHRQRNEFKAY